MHFKIARNFGKPNFCEICGTQDRNKHYVWANVNHFYNSYARADWLRLCKRCHHLYDKGKLLLTNKNIKA